MPYNVQRKIKMKAQEIDNYEELLEEADIKASNDWEMDFVSDLKEKFEQYGDDTYVSEAQLEKLEVIANLSN